MRDRTLKGCEASRMPSTHISLNYHTVLCTKGRWIIAGPRVKNCNNPRTTPVVREKS